MKNCTLTHGPNDIKVRIVSKPTMIGMCESFGWKDPGAYIGLYTGSDSSIWLREDAKFDTLLHEIFEYIASEFGVEISHEQLSVISKILADIFIENRKKFQELLKEKKR